MSTPAIRVPLVPALTLRPSRLLEGQGIRGCRGLGGTAERASDLHRVPRGTGQGAQGLSAAVAAIWLGCLGRCPRPAPLAGPSPTRCWGPAGQVPLSLLCVFQLLTACPDIRGWGVHVLQFSPRYLRSECREMHCLVLRCFILLIDRPLMVRRGQPAKAMLAVWGWVRGAGQHSCLALAGLWERWQLLPALLPPRGFTCSSPSGQASGF